MRTILLCGLVACASPPEQPGDVPVSDAELLAWCESGEYLDYAGESAPHDSGGPHFGDVQVFVNPELQGSLDAGNPTHPVGAASVKELYGDGDTVLGWSVMVKVAEGEGGDTWYWWEVFEGDTLIDGVGKSACTGCHGSGTDHFRTAWPLE